MFLGFAVAQSIPNYQDRYVNDFAGVLDSAQQGMLRGLFMQVEQNTTAQIVFVSLASIDGADIGAYATQLGREWGVGQSDKNNGLVILYVADLKKIYVASGYGIEGILPDSKIGRLLDESYVPLKDSGDIGGGIVSASELFAKVMFENAEEIRSGKSAKSNIDFIIDILPILIWVAILIFIIVRNAKRRKGKDSGFWLLPLFLPSGRSHGGVSGGGFGGGGFGGGGFGGGGAGR